MNKTEFISAIAEKAGVTKADATKMVKAYADVVTEQMIKGDKIQLIGFGTFETSKRNARTGKNPQTGEPMKIAACTVPKFKPGKALKDTLNK